MKNVFEKSLTPDQPKDEQLAEVSFEVDQIVDEAKLEINRTREKPEKLQDKEKSLEIATHSKDSIHERRREIFRSIEVRLEFMGEIRKLIEQYKDGDMSFSEYLDEIYTRFLSKLPQTAHHRYEVIKKLEDERNSANSELSSQFEALYPNEVTHSVRYDKALSEDSALKAIELRRRNLEEQLLQQRSEDTTGWAVFLEQAYKLRDAWIHKHEQVSAMSNDKEAVAHEISALGKLATLGKDDIVEIRKTPIELVVILTHDAYRRVSGGAGGFAAWAFHYSKSPFTVAPEGVKNQYLRHESIHSLTDSFMYYENPVSNLGSYIEPVPSAQHHAAYYIDRMQGEIVTAASDWEADKDKHITHGEPIPPNASSEQVEYAFNRYLTGMSTAGGDILGSIQVLEQVMDRSNSSEKKKILSKLELELMREFVRVCTVIEYDVELARRVSEEAGEEAELLLAMLPPSKYRHIRRWIEEKYGSKVQQEESLMRSERFSNPAELRQALQTVGEHELPIKTQLAIERNLMSLAYGISVNSSSLEECKEFGDNLIKLSKLCPNIKAEIFSPIERRAYELLFAANLLNGFVNMSKYLMGLLPQLEEKERNMLTATITQILENGELYREMRREGVVPQDSSPQKVIENSVIGETFARLGITALPEEQAEEDRLL